VERVALVGEVLRIEHVIQVISIHAVDRDAECARGHPLVRDAVEDPELARGCVPARHATGYQDDPFDLRPVHRHGDLLGEIDVYPVLARAHVSRYRHRDNLFIASIITVVGAYPSSERQCQARRGQQ